MDSDLAEAVSALKDSFRNRKIPVTFGQSSRDLIESLRTKLHLPRRYREFLSQADPVSVETRTPAERVRLVPAQELLKEQMGFALTDDGKPCDRPSPNGWKPSWVIVAHSTLLGDPYFLDTALPDAEGDCPVLTAMCGTETWKPRLCASSFALFVRILAIGMELAEDFADDDSDVDDESVFREAVGPRIRQFDPAALKAGHWT